MKHIFLAAALALATTACSDTTDTSSEVVTLPPVVNPNTATYDEIVGAGGGVVPDYARAIVDNRPYADGVAFAEFAKANGIDAVLDDVFIPLSLNKTAEEDFLVIPDLSERMAHEFIEYRPYTSMAQFEGEMGKYVNAEEVARLRRYVTLD